MKLIARIGLGALALLVAAEIIPGLEVDSVYAAIIAAIILGLLNAVVRPILIVLTLPITIVTLGLFIIILNASLFYFAATFIDGFSVSSFWSAILSSILVSLITTIGNRYIK
jgi:putative membrane protein